MQILIELIILNIVAAFLLTANIKSMIDKSIKEGSIKQVLDNYNKNSKDKTTEKELIDSLRTYYKYKFIYYTIVFTPISALFLFVYDLVLT